MPPRIQPQLQAICSRRASAIGMPVSPCPRAPPPILPFRNELRRPLDRSPVSSANFHTSSNLQVKKKNMVPDVSRQPWVLDRMARNKEARDEFRETRRLEREATAAHPVWGVKEKSDFIKKIDKTPSTLRSLDSLVPETSSSEDRLAMFGALVKDERLGRLNHGLKDGFLHEAIETARLQSYPPTTDSQIARTGVLTVKDISDFHAHNIRATAAIHRIMSLGNGDSTDFTQANKRFCIDTFGRHKTDDLLPPTNAFPDRKLKLRVGPDTGSSEVQAAILTVRIRKLAAHVEKNNKDKHNKARLRQLTHKRQKQLRYLRRKERGGERYRNAMEQLGLDDDAIDQELFM